MLPYFPVWQARFLAPRKWPWFLPLLGLFASLAYAEEDAPPLRLQEVFDVIVLNAESDHEELKVEPLDPRPADIDPRAKPLEFSLFEEPDVRYSVATRHVARVDYFEGRALEQIAREIEAEQFDRAYDNLRFLQEQNADFPGVTGALHRYLYARSEHEQAAGQWERAWVLLDELHARNPDYESLQQALAALGDHFVREEITAERFASARRLMERFAEYFPETPPKFLQARRDGLRELARTALKTCLQEKAGDRPAMAYAALDRARDIWPELPRLAAIQEELQAATPRLKVGVNWVAPRTGGVASLWDAAARRTFPLVHRPLFRLRAAAPGEPRYEFPWGNWEQNAGESAWLLRLGPTLGPSFTTADLAARLLMLGHPRHAEFLPAWSSVLRDIEATNPRELRVRLYPHPVPEALLRDVAWSADAASLPNGPFRLAHRTPSQVTFSRETSHDANGSSYLLVTEQAYGEEHDLLSDMRAGQLDLAARVPLRNLRSFRLATEIEVRRYAYPRVHILLPNLGKASMRNRTFRRGLAYAFDREAILSRDLLAGQSVAGCARTTGPFPIDESFDDPLGYAYDPQVSPRPYDPRLAWTLLRVGWKQSGHDSPDAEERVPITLSLAHPPTFTARTACVALAEYFELLGGKLVLHAVPPEEMLAAARNYDLFYVELAMWEPVADIQRLFDRSHPWSEGNAYLWQNLRELEEIAAWDAARNKLQAIHRLVHEEVLVIPLWQLVDHFAIRRGITGVPARPVALYEHLAARRGTAPREEGR